MKSETNVLKMTKYSIRKLSVGVGPVAAILSLLLGGSLLGLVLYMEDQVTTCSHVHLGYVTEEGLTAEERIHAIPEELSK